MAEASTPSRARVPVEATRPAPDPARTGCLWAGGILGVIGGIVFVFFGVPPLLNFLFPSETIAIGETYADDKLTMRIEGVSPAVYPFEAESWGFTVLLSIEAKTSWSLKDVQFILETDTGEEFESRTPIVKGGQVNEIPRGATSLLLLFVTEPSPQAYESSAKRAVSLHVSDPNVEFELQEPARP